MHRNYPYCSCMGQQGGKSIRRMDSNLYVTSECGCGFYGNYNSSQLRGYVTTAKSYETRVVSRYLAERTKPPVMLATIIPVVTPVRTGYRPDYYVSVYNGESDPLVFSVSDTDYGTLLEGKEVTVTYYYINDTLYNVKLNDYDCANRINLRDSNIFTQHKLLEEALNSKTPKEGL